MRSDRFPGWVERGLERDPFHKGIAALRDGASWVKPSGQASLGGVADGVASGNLGGLDVDLGDDLTLSARLGAMHGKTSTLDADTYAEVRAGTFGVSGELGKVSAGVELLGPGVSLNMDESGVVSSHLPPGLGASIRHPAPGGEMELSTQWSAPDVGVPSRP